VAVGVVSVEARVAASTAAADILAASALLAVAVTSEAAAASKVGAPLGLGEMARKLVAISALKKAVRRMFALEAFVPRIFDPPSTTVSGIPLAVPVVPHYPARDAVPQATQLSRLVVREIPIAIGTLLACQVTLRPEVRLASSTEKRERRSSAGVVTVGEAARQVTVGAVVLGDGAGEVGVSA
jgi:hypothetical protein